MKQAWISATRMRAPSVALFVGTNALGTWDELFFICTCFALLRRHLVDWQANLIQAVLFTSFLWESASTRGALW